jgi:hypothetical protein
MSGTGALAQQSVPKQGGTPAFEKLTSYKIDTKLSHLTSQVWVFRLNATAVTLDCEPAFSSSSSPRAIERQAYWLISSNLWDTYAYLLATHKTAKSLHEALQAEFQGKSFIRTTDLLQQLS